MHVVKYYDEFVLFCRHLGENQYPEDLVQELFIYIHNKEVTKSYCLTWLQWKVLDLHRAKKKITKVSLNELPQIQTNDLPYEVDMFENVYWFHQRIFDLWADGMSIRKIAKETKISARVVQHSINIIKRIWHEQEKSVKLA